MIWAIVSKSGKFEIRFDDPATTERASARRNRTIWRLDREPVEYLGEKVSFETGAILFDAATAAAMLAPKIKEACQSAILREFPLWRQINDLTDPDSPEKLARSERRTALRRKSNELEALATAAPDRAAVEAIWIEVLALEKGN